MSETPTTQSLSAEVETNVHQNYPREIGTDKVLVDNATGEISDDELTERIKITRKVREPGKVRTSWNTVYSAGVKEGGDLWKLANDGSIPIGRRILFILNPDAREVNVAVSKEPGNTNNENDYVDKDTRLRTEYADLDTEIKSVNGRGEKDPQKDLDIATDKVVSWYMLGRRHQTKSPLPKGYKVREVEKGVIEIYNPNNKGGSVFIKYKTEFWPNNGFVRRYTAEQVAIRLQNPNNPEDHLDIMPQKGTPDYNEQMGMVLGVMRPNLNTNYEQPTEPVAEPEATKDTVKTETGEIVGNKEGEIKKLQEQLAQLEKMMAKLENSIQGVEKEIKGLKREEEIYKYIIRALKKRLSIAAKEGNYDLQTGESVNQITTAVPSSPNKKPANDKKTGAKPGAKVTKEGIPPIDSWVVDDVTNAQILRTAQRILREGEKKGKLKGEEVEKLIEFINRAHQENPFSTRGTIAAINSLSRLQNKISS